MKPIAVVLMSYLVYCQAKLLYIEEKSSTTGTIDCGNLRVALQRAVYGANYEVTDQVKGLCEGEHECSIDASNKFKPGDPCPGAGKAMWISAWCDGVLQEFYYIPESKTGIFSCESTVLDINFAIYGIWTDVTDKVISECTPQPTPSSCVVFVPSNTWAGVDPCFKIMKSLWVSYDCVPW